MPDLDVSVQLYSVKEAIDISLPNTLQRLAAIGFRHVEPFGLGDETLGLDARLERATALALALNDASLSVSTAHASLTTDLETLADEAHRIGAQTVIIPNPKKVAGFSPDTFASIDKARRFAETVSNASDRLSTLDITLGYHNHEFEWENGPEPVTAFWEEVSPAVVAQVDLYWAAVAGADFPALLDLLGSRLISVHVKDGPTRRGEPQTPLGTGEVPLPWLLPQLPPPVRRVLEIDVTNMDRFSLLAENLAALASH